MTTRTVAVLGTGTMGEPIARTLLRAGFTVRVWNRTRDRADGLAGDGASVVDDPRDAVAGADVVITMLLDADAVTAVMTDDLLGAMSAAVWAQMSTVGVAGTDRLAARAHEHGVRFVDAPVLGTREPAEKGALVVLAAGPDDARAAVDPVFAALGNRTVWLDPVGAASRLKLVMNSWVLAVDTAVAEAVGLAEGLGLPPRLFLDTLEGTTLDLPYAHLKGDAMIARTFAPSFSVRGAHKDAGLVLAAARLAGVRTEVAAAAERQLARAIELGHGDEDFAAAYYAVVTG